MEEKNIEKLLDELIAEASGPVIQKLTEEDLKHLDDAYPYEISEEHERKMKEIFKMAGYARNGKRFEYESEIDNEIGISDKNYEENAINIEKTNNSNKVTKKSIYKKLLIAALIATFVCAIGCVGAFRESFVKYYLNIKEECSEVKKITKLNEYEIDNIHFGYMPSEYKISTKKMSSDSKMILFLNDNNKYIELEIQNKDYGKEVNTEDATIEELVINEKDMIYSERNDRKILTWRENDRVLVLSTDDTKELLLKLAEKLIIID